MPDCPVVLLAEKDAEAAAQAAAFFVPGFVALTPRALRLFQGLLAQMVQRLDPGFEVHISFAGHGVHAGEGVRGLRLEGASGDRVITGIVAVGISLRS